MKLRFWQRDTIGPDAPRASKPKEIPDGVGRYLVVTLKQNPDWIWGLMVVFRDRPGGGSVRDMCVFDPKNADQQGIEVRDYNQLSQHPELILFQGWYDKRQGAFEIKPHANPAATSAVA